MLDAARHRLTDVLDTLGDDIAAGVRIVMLEPSCLAVFRDELRNLFPHDESAHRLAAQTRTLAGLLVADDRVPDVRLARAALVHAHCHQQALVGMDDECRLFDRIGIDYRLLDSGCCGMAGSFGFERDHVGISLAVGERVLLPAVRQAPDEALILADGFSCREQIAQTTERRALHVAQLLHLAMTSAHEAAAPREERRYVIDHSREIIGARSAAGALLTAIGIGLAVRAWRRRRARTCARRSAPDRAPDPSRGRAGQTPR
jgi:Fe-S oxidoreductase